MPCSIGSPDGAHATTAWMTGIRRQRPYGHTHHRCRDHQHPLDPLEKWYPFVPGRTPRGSARHGRHRWQERAAKRGAREHCRGFAAGPDRHRRPGPVACVRDDHVECRPVRAGAFAGARRPEGTGCRHAAGVAAAGLRQGGLGRAGGAEPGGGGERVWVRQLCGRAIWFVPGVRNPVADVGLHDCEAMDMMRGEEAETMGLIERLKIAAPALIVLPGSHTKFVLLDAQQRIANCVTTLSGELLQVITHDTIVADSLGSDFADRIEPEMLFAGARSARSLGLGRACFMVRTLGQFTRHDRNARANFLLGAVLGADLLTLEHSSALRLRPETRCIVAAKPTLRQAYSLLLANDDFFSAAGTTVSDDEQHSLAGFGAIRLARGGGWLVWGQSVGGGRGVWLEAVRPWPPRGGCPGKKGEIWQRNRRDRWHRRFTSGWEHWAWCWHRSARRRRLRTSPRSVFWSSRQKSRGSRMSGSLPSRRRGKRVSS